MPRDIPAAELDALRRRIASRREGVPIRYRDRPLHGPIDQKSEERWQWANITGRCVRGVRGRIIVILHHRAD